MPLLVLLHFPERTSVLEGVLGRRIHKYRVKIDTGSAQIKLRKELSKHLVAKAIMMEEKTKKNSLIN